MKLVHSLGMLCAISVATASVAVAQSSNRAAAAPRAFTPTLPGEATAETALDGHCAVCVAMDKGWVKGDPNISSVVDGKRYHFPSHDVKATFDADPAKFVPAAGGDCVVCQVDRGHKMAGSVRHSARYRGRLYLFSGDEQKQAFVANPAKYANADLAYNGDCAVCHVSMNKRVAGSAEHTAVFRGKRYQFPSEKERQAFLADPAKYAEPAGA